MIAECGERNLRRPQGRLGRDSNCDERRLGAIDLILAATEPAVWQDCATEATIANALRQTAAGSC
ncbi:MAG: hypothetical protein ACLVB5_11100 [Christensenellales bacterium]